MCLCSGVSLEVEITATWICQEIRHPGGQNTSPSELPSSPTAGMPRAKQRCQSLPSRGSQREENSQEPLSLQGASFSSGKHLFSMLLRNVWKESSLPPLGPFKTVFPAEKETFAVFCLPFASLPWDPGKGGGKCVSGKWGGKLWCTLYSFSESFTFRQSKNSVKEQKPGLNSGPCLQQTPQLSDLWSLQCDGLRLCPFCFWRMSLNNLNLVVNYKITKQLGFLPSPCS